MKRAITILLATVCALAICGCVRAGTGNEQSDEIETKEFNLLGLTLEYPADWSTRADGDNYYITPTCGGTCFIVHNDITGLDAVERQTSSTIKECVQAVLDGMKGNEEGGGMSNLTFGETDISSIANGQKAVVPLSFTKDSTIYQGYACLAMQGDNMYTVLIGIPQDATKEYYEEIEAMIESVSVKKYESSVSTDKSSDSEANTTQNESQESTEQPSSNVAPAPETTAPAPETTPSVSSEYDAALKTAQRYIDMTGFSKAALYEQLTSEYGSGFPADAAQYAIDNVKVDWNAEALESAQSYVDMSGFSKAGLYEQLTSEYGSQYTPEEAQYAVDNVNVNWNDEALEAARSYRELGNMSNSQIYDQLVSEYGSQFTPEEAQYAVDHL